MRACPTRFKIAVIAATQLLLPIAFGVEEDPFWRDQNGKREANTESRSSKDGFGGCLLITADADWKEKWDTSPDTIPRFKTTEMVGYGKTIYILIFFSNPLLTGRNECDVTCDIDITRPDGSASTHQVDAPAFRSELKGPASNVYLSRAVIQFVGEKNDPPGKWKIQINLKDNHRHVQLPLSSSFTLK